MDYPQAEWDKAGEILMHTPWEEEIAMHGKLISFRHTIARSKKQYTRNAKHKSHWHE